MRPVLRLNPFLSRPWFLLLQSLFRRLLLLFFPFVSSPTYVSKGKGNNVRGHNNKKYLLICSFCKNKGHYVETCYTRQRILQNTTALTQSELSAKDSHSKSGPASSLSIANLLDMVNQVHLPSSSASNTTLSTISGTSPTWLLDSACCNHMTSSPDVIPSHTSTSLPTIYTANGSPMHVCLVCHTPFSIRPEWRIRTESGARHYTIY